MHNVDVACISESWVSETHYKDNIEAYKINGYNLYLFQRSRAGGGVALYIKDKFYTTDLKHSLMKRNVESVWVEITIHKKTIRLGLIYRAPNSEETYNNDLLEEMKDMASIKTPLLILGDFNFPDINWVTKLGNNVNSNKLVETINDLFLEQLVNTPTREISNNILDLILTNSPEIVQNINVLESLGNSDHNIIMFNITMNKNDVNNNIKVPNFNRGD